MEKGILIVFLALTVGLVFVGGAWAQKNSLPGAFSGTITKIDLAKKEIVVQNNNDAEAIFRWNGETAIKGPGERSLIFEDLKEGMIVTVLFREGSRNRVASRIDVKTANPKTLKGIEFPFECGVTVC